MGQTLTLAAVGAVAFMVLGGLLYRYGLVLLHTVMFRGLLRAIARRAVEGDGDLHRAAAGVSL